MQGKARVALGLFCLGAVLGTGLDILYVSSGVERYAKPVLFGIAWWVPLLFGGAAVAIGLSHSLLDPLLHQRIQLRRLSVSFISLTWLLLAYVIGATPLHDLAIFGLLAIIYFNFWLLASKSWQGLLLSLVTAITGTLIEMVLVNAGAFSYLHHPDIAGVPYWLPWLYACASLAVGDVGRSLMSLVTRGLY